MGYLSVTLAAAFLFIYVPISKAKTRRIAERIKCAINMRQIYLAFHEQKRIGMTTMHSSSTPKPEALRPHSIGLRRIDRNSWVHFQTALS